MNTINTDSTVSSIAGCPLDSFTFCEKQNLKGMYLCVLVKGTLPSGERGYCYFGVFANAWIEFLKRYKAGKLLNPKDLKAIVLARSIGEPTPEIAEFMRMKFSHSTDSVILELSRT